MIVPIMMISYKVSRGSPVQRQKHSVAVPFTCARRAHMQGTPPPPTAAHRQSPTLSLLNPYCRLPNLPTLPTSRNCDASCGYCGVPTPAPTTRERMPASLAKIVKANTIGSLYLHQAHVPSSCLCPLSRAFGVRWKHRQMLQSLWLHDLV